MIKNKSFIIIIAIVAIVATAFLSFGNKSEEEMLKVVAMPIQTATGWGYQVLVDGHVFIRQETIPAISGERAFKTKQDAMSVGNFAVRKIVKGLMPVITKEDLKRFKISE